MFGLTPYAARRSGLELSSEASPLGVGTDGKSRGGFGGETCGQAGGYSEERTLASRMYRNVKMLGQTPFPFVVLDRRKANAAAGWQKVTQFGFIHGH